MGGHFMELRQGNSPQCADQKMIYTCFEGVKKRGDLKMNTLKKHVVCASATLVLMGGSQAFAITAAEFALIADIQNTITAHPEATALSHNQCNQLPVTKSPINKKSLNAACNLCLGEEKTTYAIFPVSYTQIFSTIEGVPGDTILNVCQNNTITSTTGFVPFSSQFSGDFSSLCESRGGFNFNIAGVVAMCFYIAS